MRTPRANGSGKTSFMAGQRDRAALLGENRTLWSRLLAQVSAATGRREDAGDLLHSAWVRLAEYRGPEVRNTEAFLVRTAINAARDDARREQRQATLMTHEDMAGIVDDAPHADEVLDARRRLHAVRERLGRMNPRTVQIVTMHRIDGLTYREIAQRLGISESSVEKHMAKAALALMKLR